MSGELVGPLRRIYFSDSFLDRPRYYDLPRNTRDLRYESCLDHRPACDCREASIAEAFGEHKAEYDELHNAVLAGIKGHPTYAATAEGRPDEFAMCKCGACGIARAARVGYWEWKRQREESRERIEAQARARRSYFSYADEVAF